MKYVSAGWNSKTQSNIITSDDDWRFTPWTNVTVAAEQRSLACWLTWVLRSSALFAVACGTRHPVWSSWTRFRSDWILMTLPFPFVVKIAVEMKVWSKDTRANMSIRSWKSRPEGKTFYGHPGLPGRINALLFLPRTTREALKMAILSAATYTLGLI